MQIVGGVVVFHNIVINACLLKQGRYDTDFLQEVVPLLLLPPSRLWKVTTLWLIIKNLVENMSRIFASGTIKLWWLHTREAANVHKTQ